MPNKAMPQKIRDIQKKLSYQWRYDKSFCQYLDQGLDPGEAAEKAHEKASSPLTWDFGPEGADEDE